MWIAALAIVPLLPEEWTFAEETPAQPNERRSPRRTEQRTRAPTAT
jgi:hypothetical protein